MFLFFTTLKDIVKASMPGTIMKDANVELLAGEVNDHLAGDQQRFSEEESEIIVSIIMRHMRLA